MSEEIIAAREKAKAEEKIKKAEEKKKIAEEKKNKGGRRALAGSALSCD